jgi:predicted GTPase
LYEAYGGELKSYFKAPRKAVIDELIDNDTEKIVSNSTNSNESRQLSSNKVNKEKNDCYQHDDSDINILLLGETGVGKSTFINAFYNYINHNSLEGAEKNVQNDRFLIPSMFHWTDNELQTKSIQMGKSENECFVEGQSSTQNAKAYKFNCDGKTIQIIDTPGKNNNKLICLAFNFSSKIMV